MCVQFCSICLEKSNLGVALDLRLFVHFSSIQRRCLLYSHVSLLHIICTNCLSTSGVLPMMLDRQAQLVDAASSHFPGALTWFTCVFYPPAAEISRVCIQPPCRSRGSCALWWCRTWPRQHRWVSSAKRALIVSISAWLFAWASG
jgi:hypothetical protein